MKKFLLFFLIVFTLILCAEEELQPQAQLPAIGVDYNFSYPIEMTVWDNELYVLDQKNAKILVFNSDTFKFKRSFGSFGQEAVQFNKPVAIIPDNQGNLIVSDYGNGRLQIISPMGLSVDSIDRPFSWRLSSRDDEYFQDLFPGVPQSGIYKINDYSDFELMVDLGDYFEENNFHSVLDKYYSWCAFDSGFVLSFSGRDKIVIFDNKGNEVLDDSDPLPLSLPNTLYGKPFPYNDGFLILGSANDHVRADTTSTEINYEGVIGYYSFDGVLRKSYRLPDLPWLSDAWTLDKNELYIYDSGRFIINKFIID